MIYNVLTHIFKGKINMFKKIIFIFLAITGFIILINFSGLSSLKADSGHQFNSKDLSDTSNDKPAEQVFKNIQVLKGMPASKLHTVMRFISYSLGTRCDYCHVTADKGPWPMEKDDKKPKETAREMITMMKKINDESFEGRQEVNCATCHNGSTKPSSFAPFQTERTEIKVNKDSLPDANVLLDKYVNSVSGKSGFDNFKTREIKGEISSRNGSKDEITIYQTSQNKYFILDSSAQGNVLKGYNGKMGWIKTPHFQSELDEDDLTDIIKDAEFNRETNISGYTKLKVTGMQKIPALSSGGGEHKAYEVRGMDIYGNFVKMYFDTESGYLLRYIYFKQNPFGSIPVETNYDDYRDVDGVKLPFSINQRSPNSNETLKISEIKHNVSIDDSIFEMPPKEGKD